MANSALRAMKTQMVKTWKESPVMATSTAVLLPPEETDDRAPPTACRMREKTSQGYRGVFRISGVFAGLRAWVQEGGLGVMEARTMKIQ